MQYFLKNNKILANKKFPKNINIQSIYVTVPENGPLPKCHFVDLLSLEKIQKNWWFFGGNNIPIGNVKTFCRGLFCWFLKIKAIFCKILEWGWGQFKNLERGGLFQQLWIYLSKIPNSNDHQSPHVVKKHLILFLYPILLFFGNFQCAILLKI